MNSADECLTSANGDKKNITGDCLPTLPLSTSATENNYVNISGNVLSDTKKNVQRGEKKAEELAANIYEERVNAWGLWLQRASITYLVLKFAPYFS